jgi:hypothetical protein
VVSAPVPRPRLIRESSRRLLVLTVVILTLVGLALGAFAVDDGWWALSWLGYVVVGGVVLMKKSGNTIGRLLLTIGFCWAVNFALFLLMDRFPATPNSVWPNSVWPNSVWPNSVWPNSVWVEMASSILGYTSWILLVVIPVVFPHGKPTDRLTKWLLRLLTFVLLAVSLAELVSDVPKELTRLTSPLAVPALAPVTSFLLEDGFIVIPVLLLTSLISLLARWRRAQGPERLQYAWFVWSLGFVIVSLTITQALPDTAFLAIQVAFALLMNLIPVAIGVAVLRYRLYEIDRLVSRTVGYGLVIGILGLLYGLGAVWLPSRFVAEQPDLFVAGSTLLAAASFNPLRKRILHWVDRRFYRSRYNAEKLVAEFSKGVRNEVDIERVAADWMSLVARTMQPTSAGVWVREGSQGSDQSAAAR